MACVLAASACFGPPLRAQTEPSAAEPPVAGGLRVDPAPGALGSTRADEGGSFGWTFAPVRWGGSLSSELRMFESEGQPRRVQRVDSIETRAATYVWQPWFAQVSGGIGVLQSHALEGPANENSDSAALTGHGALSVFPASRFPFQARYERTDSRTSGDLASSDFTTTRYGVRQNYRPNGSGTNYSFSRDRSVYESERLGRDTLDVWDARAMSQAGAQRYDVMANRSRNSRSTDGTSQIDRLSVRHNYREGGARLSVDSLASVNDNQFSEPVSTGTIERRSRFRQLNSFANWTPAEGSPWYLTGGARLFQADVEDDGMRGETRTLSANLGANYQWTRKARISGIVAVTEVLTDTRRDVISTQGLNLSYSPDTLPLGPYLYGRSMGAGATNEHGGPEGDRRTLTGQFDHNLTRTSAVGDGASLSTNVAQGVSVTDDSQRGSTTTFLHSAGVSWNASPSQNSSAYAALTAADSRRTGADENHFQLVNLQANGQFQFSRYAFGSVNLTSQATRSETPLTASDGFDVNTSGNLAYQHGRAFGVPGLRYYAIYTASDSQPSSRRLGDLDASPDQASQSLEQRLEYDIGRLETRLLARIAEVQGRYNALVFLRVTRRFGAF